MEFLWRIFPLLRANRLYAIFNTGLKKWLLRVRGILFVFFYPEYLALVPSATNPVQQLTFLLSISADGKESPLPFQGPSQSFGFSLLPPGQAIFLGLLDVTQVPFFFHQVTKYKHLFFHSDLDLLLWDWPTFLWCLNGHSLMACHC